MSKHTFALTVYQDFKPGSVKLDIVRGSGIIVESYDYES